MKHIKILDNRGLVEMEVVNSKTHSLQQHRAVVGDAVAGVEDEDAGIVEVGPEAVTEI